MPLPALTLRDGREVRLRAIRPGDKSALDAAFRRLSPETARLRFLVPKARLTAAELRYLTEVDGADHTAIVATPAGEPGRIVAVGRLVRLAEDPATAEVAIVVGDDWQGQGLGRHLGLVLADAARERGIARLSASMLTDNVAAHRVLAAISERLRSSQSGGVDELVAELAA